MFIGGAHFRSNEEVLVFIILPTNGYDIYYQKRPWKTVREDPEEPFQKAGIS